MAPDMCSEAQTGGTERAVNRSAGGGIRVSIMSPFFPNYRNALFRRLSTSQRYSFLFIGSPTRHTSNGVPGLEHTHLSNFIHLRSLALPGGLVWQTGAVAHALNTESLVIVLTGDIHHLSSWLAAIVARARGRKVVFWTHGWIKLESHVRSFVRNRFYRLASDLFLYGSYAATRGGSYGFRAERMHIIWNSMGAPIMHRSSLESYNHSRTTHQRWIVISRLIPARQIASVIRGVSELRDSGRHVRLTIVGDGPSRDSLEREARQAKVDVEFLGAVHDLARTGELLRQSDLCVSPGNVGLAAVHALSSGCPVSTHDDPTRQMPEAEAVIDGLTGVRFPYGDVTEMVERSWRFVASTSPDQVAQACHREVMARWTPEAQADAIEKALDKIVTRSRSRNR